MIFETHRCDELLVPNSTRPPNPWLMLPRKKVCQEQAAFMERKSENSRVSLLNEPWFGWMCYFHKLASKDPWWIVMMNLFSGNPILVRMTGKISMRLPATWAGRSFIPKGALWFADQVAATPWPFKPNVLFCDAGGQPGDPSKTMIHHSPTGRGLFVWLFFASALVAILPFEPPPFWSSTPPQLQEWWQPCCCWQGEGWEAFGTSRVWCHHCLQIGAL